MTRLVVFTMKSMPGTGCCKLYWEQTKQEVDRTQASPNKKSITQHYWSVALEGYAEPVHTVAINTFFYGHISAILLV